MVVRERLPYISQIDVFENYLYWIGILYCIDNCEQKLSKNCTKMLIYTFNESDFLIFKHKISINFEIEKLRFEIFNHSSSIMKFVYSHTHTHTHTHIYI